MLDKFYPLPNLPVGGAVFPNLLSTRPVRVDDDKMGVKIDHRFANNGTVFGRFNYTDPQQITPQTCPLVAVPSATLPTQSLSVIRSTSWGQPRCSRYITATCTRRSWAC